MVEMVVEYLNLTLLCKQGYNQTEIDTFSFFDYYWRELETQAHTDKSCRTLSFSLVKIVSQKYPWELFIPPFKQLMKLLNQLCPSAVKRQGLSNLLCNFSFKKKSVPVTKNRRDMVENNLVPVGEAFCKHSITGMYSKHDESLRTLQSPPFFCHNWHSSTLTLFQITSLWRQWRPLLHTREKC